MTGKAPADWKDVAFFRSTGQAPGWLAALTKRHKLVLGVQDPPWLMDLERDPDELTNFAEHKDYRETTRILAKELIAYSQTLWRPLRWAQEDQVRPGVVCRGRRRIPDAGLGKDAAQAGLGGRRTPQ